MKIAWAQLNFHIGNFNANAAKIIEQINIAKVDSVELIVFPELSLCGYPPLDFLESNHFIEECSKDINLFSKNIKKDFDKKLKDEFTNVSQTLYIEIEDAFQKPIDNQNTILWDLKTIEKLFLVKKLLGKLCQNH